MYTRTPAHFVKIINEKIYPVLKLLVHKRFDDVHGDLQHGRCVVIVESLEPPRAVPLIKKKHISMQTRIGML